MYYLQSTLLQPFAEVRLFWVLMCDVLEELGLHPKTSINVRGFFAWWWYFMHCA